MAETIFTRVKRVDLNRPLIRCDGGTIGLYDNAANRYGAEIVKDGANVYLSGVSVTGYFIRPSNDTIILTGKADGNTAYVDLNEACYSYEGAYSLAVKITGSGFAQTVIIYDGHVAKTRTDALVDNDRVIPSIEELLAKIADTEAATKKANTAATNAETAATKANTAATNASTAASNANTKAGAAQTAADAANAAAKAWGDSTAADSAKLGGMPPEAFFARNLLDNSDFSNPINQRGKTVYDQTAASGYTIDRWRAQYCTITAYDGRMRFDAPAIASYKRFMQWIEEPMEAGKTYTAAMYARINDNPVLATFRPIDNTSLMTGASGLAIEGTTSDYQWFICTFTPTAAPTKPGVEIFVSNSEERTFQADIKYMALYEGDYTAESLPMYEPKGSYAEWIACREYNVRIGGSGSQHCSVAVATTTELATAAFDVGNMRLREPSCDYTENIVLRNGTTDIAVTSVTANNVVNGIAYLNFAASGLTKGGVYMVRLTDNAYIDINADL